MFFKFYILIENRKEDNEIITFNSQANNININNSIYDLDSRIWKFNRKEIKSDKSYEQANERKMEYQDLENKETSGILGKNLLKSDESEDAPAMDHLEPIPLAKRDKCFSIDNIEFLNDLNFVNFKNPSFLFNVIQVIFHSHLIKKRKIVFKINKF